MRGTGPDRAESRGKPPFSGAAEVLGSIDKLQEQHPYRIPRDSLDNILELLASSDVLPPELEHIGEQVFMKGLRSLAASFRIEEAHSAASTSYQRAVTQADDFLYFVAKVDRLIATYPPQQAISKSNYEPEKVAPLSDHVEILISVLKSTASEEDGAVSPEDLIEVFDQPQTTRRDLEAIRRAVLDSARSIIKDSGGEDSYLSMAAGYLELSIRAERASQARFGL